MLFYPNKVQFNSILQVARVFGDENTSAVMVTSITRGSVVYAFTNNSLSGSGCPTTELTAMADRVVTPEGKLDLKAIDALKPWKLMGAATMPKGDCEGDPNFPTRSASVRKDELPTPRPGLPTQRPGSMTDAPMTPKPTQQPPATTTNGTDIAKAGAGGSDDVWITTVVPAVVIVAILLLALCVACILYRKKRKGKMSLEDQNTFVNKGAPVIFPDELDDKPGDSSKPLLVEGSPPAPPPEYHQRGPSRTPERSTNGGPKESTPPTDHEVDAEIEVDATSPLYQPPPPVTANSGKQARPHVQQPYRANPPEIQP
jgi:neurexin